MEEDVIAKEKMIRQIINSGARYWLVYNYIKMIDDKGSEYIYYGYDNVEKFYYVDSDKITRSIPITKSDREWFKDLYNELKIK